MTMRLAGLFLLIGAATLQAQAEDSVKALEIRRGEALLKADTAALSRMMAPEFIEISRLG